jgi:hypothetical protein
MQTLVPQKKKKTKRCHLGVRVSHKPHNWYLYKRKRRGRSDFKETWRRRPPENRDRDWSHIAKDCWLLKTRRDKTQIVPQSLQKDPTLLAP